MDRTEVWKIEHEMRIKIWWEIACALKIESLQVVLLDLKQRRANEKHLKAKEEQSAAA